MVCGRAVPVRLVAVADLDGFQVEGRTPVPPCARPGPRRPGRCWCAATRWRSWSPRGIPDHKYASSTIGRRHGRGVPTGPSQLPQRASDCCRSRYGAAVVFGFHPGDEQPVELPRCGGIVDPAAARSSLAVSVTSISNCSRTVRKNRSILPRPWVGRAPNVPGVPRVSAGPQQPTHRRTPSRYRHISRWNPAGGQRRAQRGGQPHSVFGEAEPVAGRQATVVIEEGE